MTARIRPGLQAVLTLSLLGFVGEGEPQPRGEQASGVLRAVSSPARASVDSRNDLAVPGDFLSEAQAHIAAREYWASVTNEGLQAPNRAHDLRSYFGPTGVRIHERTAASSPRLLGLALARMGRGDALIPVAPGEVGHREGRVEITRADLGLVEWFENTEAGLEQGFTLVRPLPSPNVDGVLVLELSVSGAKALHRGDDVVLATDVGRKLAYGKLVAEDASGRRLAAHFEVAKVDRIRLVVDDANAIYPIVIDPLLTESADAQLESNQAFGTLGQSVAAAGDVNRDGYADVIVGAGNYDAGQTDEGAAFVFLGSASGLADGSPLNAATQLEADQPSSFLGYSVSGAGDVNGDGYSDVIVGALTYDAGQSDEGAAFVFLGSASGVADGNPTTAAARLESDQANASLGISVAGAGDVNGDGYADVIVGAIQYDAGATDEGAAFVFLGSASGVADGKPTNAAAQLESNQPGARLGASVAGAGDVNADGYADVIVGAHLYDAGNGADGAAFVFLGSGSGIASGNPATAVTQLDSNQGGAELGSSVAGAGDVNGDGYADVIVGAHFYDAGQTNEGAAFVFLGSASGVADGIPLFAAAQLESNEESAELGYSVSSAGDVNGDGYADVIVGTPYYGGFNPGAAFVFLGSASGVADGNPTTATAQLDSNQSNAWLGISVAGAGDIDGDGYADVIVGASAFNAGDGLFEGAAFVYHGGASGIEDGDLDTAHALLEGNLSVPGQVNVRVASAGDVNGDGYGDVIVGGRQFDAGEPLEGAAFLFLGSATGIASGGPLTAHAQLESNQAGALLGSCVASAGDVNGDGYGDVIVGAGLYDGAEVDEGAAFVFLGSASGIADGTPLTANARFETNQPGARMGIGCASAGDVNGDGYADVLVGAHEYSAPESKEGAAFVFLGAASMPSGTPATAHARLESNQANAALGAFLASAGDVNGDGYGDVIIGASLYDSPEVDEGAVFIFLGSASGMANGNPVTAHAQIESNQASKALGSVASAGDVNGDGYGDVIVGSIQVGIIDAGSAYIFLGSAAGISDGNPVTAHARLDGDASSGQFGFSVDSAGDVNGDGYGDVIVGSPLYDNGALTSAEGAAFVFLGSVAGIPDGGPGSASAQLESNGHLQFMGVSVASAGDVNGDGFGDVIVGEGVSGAVYLGNALGRPVVTQQRRDDGSGLPVQPGGGAFDPDSFRVSYVAASPRGRERAKLEVEVCPSGAAFGAGACTRHLSSSWTDLATSGATLTQVVPGLVANKTYSWRARALFVPYRATQLGITPIASPGPWHRLQSRAMPGDVRTVPEPERIASIVLCAGILIGLTRRRGREIRPGRPER